MKKYLPIALLVLPGCDDTESDRRHIEQFGALEERIHEIDERDCNIRMYVIDDEEQSFN
jgi:hypothetical protein